MNYILNTKTKKVEIYWDNQNEYQAIINFLSQCVLTEEKENQYFVKTNEIPSHTITWNTNNLPNSYTIYDGSILNGTIVSKAETALSSGLVDATLADANLTTITADDITTVLKAEPKEQYWLNGNPITSIKPREDKPENWQNDTYNCAGDVLCSDEFLNKVLELNQKKSNITSLRC